MNTDPDALSANRMRTPADHPPVPERAAVNWVHFGDLHLTTARAQSYRDFLRLIGEANCCLRGNVDFAHLPGDNADHGTEPEFVLAKRAVDRSQIPLFATAGDHDVLSRSLDLFRKYLSPKQFHSFSIRPYRFIFLTAFEAGDAERFDLSDAQLARLRTELEASTTQGAGAILFLHCYSSGLGASGPAVRALIQRHRVWLVEMAHTHYNELANDGRTPYAATRSSGQVEEGPVGFSITNLDGSVDRPPSPPAAG